MKFYCVQQTLPGCKVSGGVSWRCVVCEVLLCTANTSRLQGQWRCV